MIKVVSVKSAAIGKFDSMHYNATERGLVGVTSSGAGVNVLKCKLPDAQSIIQGIHNQIGKREGIIDLDTMSAPAPAPQPAPTIMQNKI